MWLTITINVAAFSLGTILLNRCNLAVGLTAFVVTALFGTILGSMIEAYVRAVLAPGLARTKRPAFRRGAKPLPSSTGPS